LPVPARGRAIRRRGKNLSLFCLNAAQAPRFDLARTGDS
jgi:hypothetical protein